MVFPRQDLSIQDPGIGATTPLASSPIISGIAHGGSGAVDTQISVNSLGQVRSLLGYGPLAEDVALALSKAGGPVLAYIHNSAQDVSLSAQALTKLVGTGPTITVSGSPNDRYNLRVEVVVGGARGTATFKYSLDAWDTDIAPFTYSQVRTTAATYLMANSGLTLAFPTGTYVAGDVYTYSCIPQEPGTTDLAAIALLLEEDPALDFNLWLVSGSQPLDDTASALAAAFQGHLVTLTQSFRYARGIIDIGSGDTAANVKAEAANWTGSRIMPCYGYEYRPSLLPFEGYSTRKISCSAGEAARTFSELISSDLSRTAAGADEGVLAIAFDGFYDQTLDAAQLSTMRTWPGVPGFYIAGGKLKCSFGSDYTDMQYGRIMDAACRTTYLAQFPFQSATFRTIGPGDSSGRPAGAIYEPDARTLEQTVTNSLNDILMSPDNASGTKGHVSALLYTVDLTNNLATSGQINTKVQLRQLGYAKVISTTLGFTLNI